MSDPSGPRLAPPGAGLPAPELFVARALFALRRLCGSRPGHDARFRAERERVGLLVNSLAPEAGARRVLIPRLRGLEDSSRHWSVWMTLEHLRIVHTGLQRIIAQLLADRVPPGAASTAAVKPGAGIGAEVRPAYESSCDALLATVSKAADLRTRQRYAHPWFGPLDAAGWHALAGVHLGIHRRQIERILAAPEHA